MLTNLIIILLMSDLYRNSIVLLNIIQSQKKNKQKTTFKAENC